MDGSDDKWVQEQETRNRAIVGCSAYRYINNNIWRIHYLCVDYDFYSWAVGNIKKAAPSLRLPPAVRTLRVQELASL